MFADTEELRLMNRAEIKEYTRLTILRILDNRTYSIAGFIFQTAIDEDNITFSMISEVLNELIKEGKVRVGFNESFETYIRGA